MPYKACLVGVNLDHGIDGLSGFPFISTRRQVLGGTTAGIELISPWSEDPQKAKLGAIVPTHTAAYVV